MNPPKITIASGEGIAEVRVCALERMHADDLEGECSECHKPIFYRPEPPFLIKFICLDCAWPKMTASNLEVVMSPKCLKEVQKYLDKMP